MGTTFYFALCRVSSLVVSSSELSQIFTYLEDERDGKLLNDRKIVGVHVR